MGFFGDIEDLERDEHGSVAFKRHFFAPGVVLTAAEVIFIALPTLALFRPTEVSGAQLLRISIPVLIGATLVWLAAITSWLAPLQRAIQLRRRKARLPKGVASAAYRATWRFPLRTLLLRSGLWTGVAVAHGVFFMRYADWEARNVFEIAGVVTIHAFAVNSARAIWYAGILAAVRTRLFPRLEEIRRFSDAYFRRLVLVGLIVWTGICAASAAYIYYFLPISHEQYVQVMAYLPISAGIALLVWALGARRLTRKVDSYLAAHLDGRGDPATSTTATAVYRRAQAIPYRLGISTIGLWVIVAIVASWLARSRLRVELDNAVLMFGITVVIALGGAIYESLWHRETMRPLLGHLTLQHRLPVRGIRPSLSLRTKLLLSFGGMVAFACGLALLWSWMQYKTLVTDFVGRQADLGLAWLRSEVNGAAAARSDPPTPELVREALRGIDQRSPEANAVFYYRSNEPGATVMALGGGQLGAPRLPWYVAAQMNLSDDDAIEVTSLSLAGRRGRLQVAWRGRRYDLGSVAVFYPNYRGRGAATVRPLKELMLFFLVLFAACGGMVLFTVAQFVKPIRKLEQRADGMARGELAEPVSSGGEGDEIGRLTFALEEMRRALREKLRSTEEVNLDLERAVQRRTADLAKKNRELAEALDKLTRAQDQLVRSEKMASIGQLVAGIAHEINNPVNAIVNTVGPLEEAVQAITSADPRERDAAIADVRDMVRVVQRGAVRTKDIVQALHNYSRTDDESVVEFDLNRSIDDSLELLRHQLKQKIKVVRKFGQVGRIRGHAGQLNQVFMNLLANSVQALAGRDGATIWIETAERDGSIVITVRDNGAGIPPEVLPRIFDPFFTTKEVGQGSGLGLSIVHGIVERHGGSTEVESAVGVGTTFTVTLPRDAEDPGFAVGL